MKWDDDRNCYEKRLLLDAIIKFSNEFRDLDAEEISLKSLYDFIDRFFEDKKYVEVPCNFCGTPNIEYPKKKCERTVICQNTKTQ
jgi:hypothetical protein